MEWPAPSVAIRCRACEDLNHDILMDIKKCLLCKREVCHSCRDTVSSLCYDCRCEPAMSRGL
jgi:hypothetical protein